MNITIKQPGGFAGVERPLASVAEAQLPQFTVAELRVRLSELENALRGHPPSAGADRLHYEIEVSADPGSPARHFTVVDEGNPDSPPMHSVQALLALLGAQ